MGLRAADAHFLLDWIGRLPQNEINPSAAPPAGEAA